MRSRALGRKQTAPSKQEPIRRRAATNAEDAGNPVLGVLYVTVRSCQDIKIGDAGCGDPGCDHLDKTTHTGLSDPYVLLQLQAGSGRRSAEMRTAFVSQTLNPVWSAANVFQLTIREKDKAAGCLFCHVYDADADDVVHHDEHADDVDDYLGGVAVDIGELQVFGSHHDCEETFAEEDNRSDLSSALGVCPDAALKTEQTVTDVTGKVLPSFLFEKKNDDQQKHPLGWIEVGVQKSSHTMEIPMGIRQTLGATGDGPGGRAAAGAADEPG